MKNRQINDWDGLKKTQLFNKAFSSYLGLVLQRLHIGRVEELFEFVVLLLESRQFFLLLQQRVLKLRRNLELAFTRQH